MDNFRHQKKQRSLDGFVAGNRPAQNGRSDLKDFTQYYKPQRPLNGAPGAPRRVDNFGSIDGFAPSVQPTINRPGERRSPNEITRAFHEPAENRRAHHADHGKPQYPLEEAKRRRFSLLKRKRDKLKHKAVKHRKLRLGLKISGAFACLLLLVGGGLGLRAFLLGRNIFKGGGNSAILNNQNVDPTQLKGEGDGRVNILVLGKGGEEQHDGPDLTDTIIIASVDPIAKEASLLSIPRDFWVKSPSGYQSKINEVYANAKYATLNNYSYKQRTSDEAKEAAEKAGIDALKQTVSSAMGVPIHYYAMIDFAGFKKAIDTVGGIDINVTEDMAVSETMWISGKNYNLNIKPGQQHFDGLKALAFSRSRKTSARGDFARSDRQRAVILALKDKILSTGTLANPLKINQLLSDFGGQVSTDFSVNEILRLYDLSKEIPADKVISVGLDQYVGGDMINGLSVQVPKAGLFDYSEIQNYVRNVMRDAFLRQEDARIVILNGTSTAGLATKKSTELKSFGYNVVSVGDAPTTSYANTILVDLRGGSKKYTLNYLQKRLNVQATDSLPDSSIDASNADFVIILGADAR